MEEFDAQNATAEPLGSIQVAVSDEPNQLRAIDHLIDPLPIHEARGEPLRHGCIARGSSASVSGRGQ